MRWEEVWHGDFFEHDLIVACNSLHLTTLGFDTALEKIFRASPKRIFVVSETYPGLDLPSTCGEYDAVVEQSYEIESSFGYHDWDEAFAHAAFKKGRPLAPVEEFDLEARLTKRGGHLWLKDTATVAMMWREKRERPARSGGDGYRQETLGRAVTRSASVPAC